MDTTDRYEDIEERYRPSVIKRCQWWTLLLHEDQRYLGRTVMWLKRPGKMQRYTDLSLSEIRELGVVSRNYERALGQLWRPDHMNYAWLGNFFHEHDGHGHMHLIPRYQSPRICAGVEFVDGRWGQNFSPYAPHKPPPEVFYAIRNLLRKQVQGGEED